MDTVALGKATASLCVILTSVAYTKDKDGYYHPSKRADALVVARRDVYIWYILSQHNHCSSLSHHRILESRSLRRISTTAVHI
eukprot:SAG31_NODE_1897_length_6964_cov_2.677349_5_plen_83_part_00